MSRHDCPQSLTRRTTKSKAVSAAQHPEVKTRAELDLQVERPSCWGDTGLAASGTGSSDTPATCTCLHLAASTLKSSVEKEKRIRKQELKLRN